GEAEDGQPADVAAHGQAHHTREVLFALGMAGRSWQATLSGPTAVAVHDARDMQWAAVHRQPTLAVTGARDWPRDARRHGLLASPRDGGRRRAERVARARARRLAGADRRTGHGLLASRGAVAHAAPVRPRPGRPGGR